MLRSAIFCLSILISGAMRGPSYGQLSPKTLPDSGIFYGIRLGLLAHDIGGLWSNTPSEEGVDFNAEIVFR